MDLHLHSASSSDFRGSATPEQIVQAALDKDLAAIAVTDHNTGEGIDAIKSAASGTDLVVFPGVELTCAGGPKNIHVVALFDPSKGTEHVSGLLAALDIKPDQQGAENALITRSIQDVIDIVQEKWDGIAVLAHANSSSGVMSDMKGEQRTRIIQHPGLMAVEATDFQNQPKIDNHTRLVDLLDGTDTTYRRHLAVYQASDNPAQGDAGGHALDGIGTRTTYFKVESINLEALAQCFADPDARILQDFEYQDHTYPRIAAISVNSGFLRDQTIPFHPGLNSVLGAKGAGKSVLIELLRFALNQPPSNPTLRADHDSKLQSCLGKYGKVEVSLVDESAHPLTVTRIYDPSKNHPYEGSDFDPAQVFPTLFLSQNEIHRLAESQDLQLQFIDQFFDFRGFRRRIEAIEERLAELDKRMADGMRAFSDVRALRPQVSSVELEIERIERQLQHSAFESFRQVTQKKASFDRQLSHIDGMVSAIADSRSALSKLRIPKLPDDLKSDPALKRNFDTLQKARALFEQHLNALEKELRSNREAIQKEHETWLPSYQEVIRQYQEHIRQAGGDYQALAKIREAKSSELATLKQRLATAEELEAQITPTRVERDKFLDQLDGVYDEYTDARKSKSGQFEKDSGSRLKLDIIESSNVDEFRDRLLSLKQGSYLREEEIDSICTKSTPREFIFALLRYAISEGDAKYLAPISKASKIGQDRMKKLADFLIEGTDFESLLALQYRAKPQDRPEIRFQVGKDSYRLLSEVSVGQKSNALLLMALSEGTRPIVIDQPEDSLDIRSIWEDICTKLRAGKRRRQFIFTTHNSSVAVASDTDMFVILEGTADSGSLVYSGSLDHEPVGTEVLAYLEGGLVTYERKYRKYRIDQRIRNRMNK